MGTALEHHAVLDLLDCLADDEGALVTWWRSTTRPGGRRHVPRAPCESDPGDVALVTVMWANNEVGTVNPIRELAAVAHGHGIPFHTDAVQALGQLPRRLRRERRRRDDRHRPQDRRPGRRRRAAAAPRAAADAAAARRRPGARRPVGHARRRRRSSASPSACRAGASTASPSGRRGWPAARRPGRRGAPRGARTRSPATRSRGRRRTGCPATPTCASPAARATRC